MIEWAIIGAIALISVAVLTASAIRKLVKRKTGVQFGEVVVDMIRRKPLGGHKVDLSVYDDDGCYVDSVEVDARSLDSEVYEGNTITIY